MQKQSLREFVLKSWRRSTEIFVVRRVSYDILIAMKTQSNITPEDIRKFRREKGFSQHKLASILGIGTVTISRWENGKIQPSGTAAVILEALLGNGPIDGVSPVTSAFAIYGLLKERFEGERGSRSGESR